MGSHLFSMFSKENQLPEKIKSFLEMLTWLPVPVTLVDADGKVIGINTRMEQLIGFTSEQIAGQPLSKYGLVWADVQALLKASATDKIIREIVTRDMESLHVSVGATRVPDSPYTLLTFEDVPDYRKTIGEKQFLQSIVSHYPFAVMVQDAYGVCRAWNDKMTQLFHVSSADAVGRKVSELMPVELSKILGILDHEVLQQQQSYLSRNMSFRKPNGEEVALAVSKVPMLKSDRVASILTVFEDITSRHAQEIELVQTRNLLQAILDNVPLGIYTRTAEGRMTYYNKQSMKVLGVSNTQYVTTPHPNQKLSDVRGYASREKAILEEGKLKEYPDEIFVDQQGNEKVIHMIKAPLMHAGPEPLVLSIVEDVTQKREQERKLMRANAFLTAIVENMPVGLYARDKDGKMLLSNKKSEEIFHDKNDQLDERGAAAHETEDQIREYLKRETDLLESGQILDIAEEPYMTETGEWISLHIVKVPVSDVAGQFSFVITMVEDITKRKEQERKLAKFSQFQQAVLDNAPLAIYARSMDKTWTFINKKAKELFPQETLYLDEHDFYSERERKVLEEGTILDIPEEEYINRNNVRLLLHLIKVPVMDQEGRPFMMLSIAEDITQKKQQEKEILQSKNFLQNIVDNLPVALSVKKPDGTYILWNKRSEQIFGVAANTVIGKQDYRQDITREQLDFVLESDKKVFNSHRELNIAQELISTPNEGVKIMHTVKTPLYNSDGDADYLLNVSEDITSKTKMERKMREAGEKNSLLVENVQEGIVILEDRKIIYSNRTACQMLGVSSSEELTDKLLADFISPDHQPIAREKYEAVVNGLEGSQEPLQLYFARPDGGRTEVELSALAEKYLGRRIVLVFFRDMTRANKMMREIRSERETFKNAFEKAVHPMLILNSKGYIQTMNQSARELFHLQEKDKVFYRNVYMRPMLALETRRQMSQGQPTEMDWVFDFDKAAEKFPGRITGEGKLPLHMSFVPFNKRDTSDGQVLADYLVTLQVKPS
ncbi:MAG: PAS domain S-box protein [Elusimicrobiaceae bacterium]|nr:PAS domain S-box protein [Elusimicrobiaceae bacterium]